MRGSYRNMGGRGSSVGIATTLRAGRSGDRIPVGGGGEIFRTLQTGPGAHAASCKMGTGSFSGVKRPGRGADPHLQCRGLKKG